MNREEELYGLDQVTIQLVKEKTVLSDYAVTSPKDAVDFVKEYLKYSDREIACVVNFNTKGQPLNLHVVSIGDLSSAYVSPVNTVKSAILSNAAGSIFFHCHPSGDCTPSKNDIQVTSRLDAAFELMGIQLLDSIIVGCNTGEWTSLRTNGAFEFSESESVRNFMSEMNAFANTFDKDSIKKEYEDELEM